MAERLIRTGEILAQTSAGEIVEGNIHKRHSTTRDAIESLYKKAGRYEMLSLVSLVTGCADVATAYLGTTANMDVANSSLSPVQKGIAILAGSVLSFGSAVYFARKEGKCEAMARNIKYFSKDLPTITTK